jgi:hypothetical protein
MQTVDAFCWVCQQPFRWDRDTPMLCPKCMSDFFRPAFELRVTDDPNERPTILLNPVEQRRGVA